MEEVYILAASNEEIKKWVEDHEGQPAIIDDPEIVNDKIGLRINWKGMKDEAMLSNEREITRDISWNKFFSIMESQKLGFMYSNSENTNRTWSYKFVNKYSTEE